MWFEKEGEKFAKLIYLELSKKRKLSSDDIADIYDRLDFPLFRKSEGVAWKIIFNMPNVEKFKDDKGRTGIILKN